jgi:hypothetical protein
MTVPLSYPTLSLGLIQKARRVVELVIFATNWKTNGDIFFNPPRNLWCHIATTYVQSTNTLSVWINGMVAIIAVVAPTRIFVASTTTDFKFYIGSGYLDSFRSWDGFFPGYIFQPLISNYIKKHKKIVYGGIALNEMLKQKKPSDVIYKDYSINEATRIIKWL